MRARRPSRCSATGTGAGSNRAAVPIWSGDPRRGEARRRGRAGGDRRAWRTTAGAVPHSHRGHRRLVQYRGDAGRRRSGRAGGSGGRGRVRPDGGDAGGDPAGRGAGQVEGNTLPTRFAVIGMGRFGGRGLGYRSEDADVLFVHEPRQGAGPSGRASRAANAVVSEMRRLLQVSSADPPLLIDADLRPEGKSGPLVRTLNSYAAYYRRWSLVWESQALLRAEIVAGDEDLGRRFIELVDPLRYPAEGLGDDAVREIRRLKARMEDQERMPRGRSDACTPSWGGAGCPTWSGPCSCSSCSAGGWSRGCGPLGHGRRWARRARRDWCPGRTRRSWTRHGCWPRGCATR